MQEIFFNNSKNSLLKNRKSVHSRWRKKLNQYSKNLVRYYAYYYII